jgi:limonene-1,2-epoxide hydrolase
MAKETASKSPSKKTTPKKAASSKNKATAPSTAKKNGSATKVAATKQAAPRKPVPTAAHSDANIEIVRKFLDACERLDRQALLALCAPNVVWVNEPFKTAGSKAQLEKVLKSMFGNVTRFRIEDLKIGQDPDGTVYTDRIDVIEGGGMSMRVRVKGVFVIRNGLVTSMTDSFSWPEGILQVVKSTPGILRFQLQKLRGKRA